MLKVVFIVLYYSSILLLWLQIFKTDWWLCVFKPNLIYTVLSLCECWNCYVYWAQAGYFGWSQLMYRRFFSLLSVWSRNWIAEDRSAIWDAPLVRMKTNLWEITPAHKLAPSRESITTALKLAIFLEVRHENRKYSKSASIQTIFVGWFRISAVFNRVCLL